MQRIAVNPWDWSQKLGYNQAEIISETKRQLICSGQTAVDETGAPQHAGDMRAQMELALSNLEAVLKSADMDLSNVIKLSIFTVDVDECLKNFDVIGAGFGKHQVSPPMSLLGVERLAIPALMFEIEATAAD